MKPRIERFGASPILYQNRPGLPRDPLLQALMLLAPGRLRASVMPRRPSQAAPLPAPPRLLRVRADLGPATRPWLFEASRVAGPLGRDSDLGYGCRRYREAKRPIGLSRLIAEVSVDDVLGPLDGADGLDVYASGYGEF